MKIFLLIYFYVCYFFVIYFTNASTIKTAFLPGSDASIKLNSEHECCENSDEYMPKLSFEGKCEIEYGLDCGIRVPTPIPSVVLRGDAWAEASIDLGLTQVLTKCENEDKKCEDIKIGGEVGVSAGIGAGWCLVTGDVSLKTEISGSVEICAGDDKKVKFANASASVGSLSASCKTCELCGIFCQEFEINFK